MIAPRRTEHSLAAWMNRRTGLLLWGLLCVPALFAGRGQLLRLAGMLAELSKLASEIRPEPGGQALSRKVGGLFPSLLLTFYRSSLLSLSLSHLFHQNCLWTLG